MPEPKFKIPRPSGGEARTFKKVKMLMRAGWIFLGSRFTKEQLFEITLKSPNGGKSMIFKSKRPFSESVSACGKLFP